MQYVRYNVSDATFENGLRGDEIGLESLRWVISCDRQKASALLRICKLHLLPTSHTYEKDAVPYTGTDLSVTVV